MRRRPGLPLLRPPLPLPVVRPIPHEAVQTAIGQQPTHVAGEVGQATFAIAAVELLLRHRAPHAPHTHHTRTSSLSFLSFSPRGRFVLASPSDVRHFLGLIHLRIVSDQSRRPTRRRGRCISSRCGRIPSRRRITATAIGSDDGFRSSTLLTPKLLRTFPRRELL